MKVKIWKAKPHREVWNNWQPWRWSCSGCTAAREACWTWGGALYAAERHLYFEHRSS